MLVAGKSPEDTPRGMIIAILLLFIAVLLAGILFYYRSQEHLVKQNVTDDLTSIALLKTNQIAAWRSERLGDAEVLSQDPILTGGVRDYTASPDPVIREKLLTLFSQINTSYHYRDAQLVDTDGRILVSLDPADTALTPLLKTQIAASLASRKAVLMDLSVGPDGSSPRMYGIAPRVSTDNGKTVPVGAVILTIDPTRDLSSLIQAWPVQSRTAETLLFEREGDHALLLNDIRHQQNTALNLTIPLSEIHVPAVAAVRGMTGEFEGTDYRGVSVISVLEPVPGSPWYMVAKVDTDEAFAAWQGSAIAIMALVGGLLAGLLVIFGFIWQRRQKYYYRALYSAEVERRKEQERYRELFENISPGSSRSTPDPGGRILAANPADLRIFGAGSLEELLAAAPEQLYADPGQRLRFSEEMMKTGSVTGMDIRFRNTQGKPFWGRITSKKCVADDGSIYFDNTVDDITERKAAESALTESEERFRLSNDSSMGSIYSYDRSGRFTSVNPKLCRDIRRGTDEIIGKTHRELGFPEEICREWDSFHRQVYATDAPVGAETATIMPSVHGPAERVSASGGKARINA